MPTLPKNISIGLQTQAKSPRVPLFEVGLLILVCALFTWFLVLPKSADLSAEKGNLEKLKSDSGTIADSLEKFKSLVKELQSSPKEISDLDYALPLEGKITHLQTLIETLAQSAGVTIGDVNVSTPGDNVWAGDKALLANPYGAQRSVKKMTGTVYVLGGLDQLEAFLRKLESSGRIIDVTALAIDPGPPGSLGLRLTVNAYFLSPY